MVAVPGDTPVATPVSKPTVAMAVVLLLHVPPGVGLLKDVVLASQTSVKPIIDVGISTVTVVVETQPAGVI